MKANETQIGGTHYKIGGEEHWDRVWRLFGHGYFVGCITKYVERYRRKDGIQDLEKAAHFLQKLIELEKGMTENVKDVGYPYVKPDGWVGYTFEGADGRGFLFTCRECRTAFIIPENASPRDYHACEGLLPMNNGE